MTLPSMRRASGMGTVTHIVPLSTFETFPELSTQILHPSKTPRRPNSSSSISSFSCQLRLIQRTYYSQLQHNFTSRITLKRHSFTHKSLSLDRSMTPLPPLPLMPMSLHKNIVHSVPHEIVPNGVISVAFPQENVQDSSPELLRNDMLSTSSSSSNEEPTGIKPQQIRIQIE